MAEQTQRRIIEIVFAGADELSGVTKKVGDGLDDFGQGIQTLSAPFTAVTEALLKFEAAVAAAGIAAAAFAVNEAVKFEASAIDLQKVLDQSDGSIARFEQSAIDLSNTFGVAATDVLQSTADFKQAGFSAEDALALVEDSLKLVNISELDAATSSELFVRLLKGFNAPASEAGRVLDILNEVSNRYATTTGDLGEALARSAPIAKQMGFSFEELAGVLTPMIDVFQDSERTSTAFNTVLQRLVSDTKDVRDGLATLGVSQTDLNGQLRLGKDILHDVEVAFGTLPPTMKSVVAQQLAGTEQAAKMVLVFDNLQKTTEVTAVALNALGSAQKELEVRMQATEVLINRTEEAWRNVAVLFGKDLLPEVGNVVKGLGEIGLAIQGSARDGAFDPLLNAAKGALRELGTTLSQIAQVFPEAVKGLDFSGFLDALGELSASLGGLFGDIDVRQAEGLRGVMQQIIDISENLIRVTTGVSDVLVPVLRYFGDWAVTIGDVGGGLAEFTGVVLGVGTALGAVGTAVVAAGAGFTGLSQVLGSGGLLKALATVETATGSTALALAGKAGLVGAALAGGYELGKFADTAFGITDKLSPFTRAVADYVNGPSADLNRRAEEAALRIKAQSDATAALTAEQRASAQALAESIPQWEQFSGTVSLIGGEFQKISDGLSATTDATKEATRQQAESLQGVLDKWREASGAQRDVTLSADLAAKGFKSQQIAVTDTETGVVSYTQALTFASDGMKDLADKAETSLSKTAEETLKAQQAANDFQLEWEKIASDERQLVFQLSADIQIAEIEAGTERIKAAFESVNTTIESTGSTIVELTKVFADLQGTAAGRDVFRLIEQEAANRQRALDQQAQLVEAQVRYLDAVVDRLGQGEAQIQITADGLQPELEAFMFKILERVQVRASAEAQQFLLGL